MANHIAVRLDRLGVAEMSCVAGVGGDVKPLVCTALSGRPILALDGCPLHCVARTLNRHGIRPTWHLDLSEHGVRKGQHQDFDLSEAAEMLNRALACLGSNLASHTGAFDERVGDHREKGHAVPLAKASRMPE